MPNNPPEGVEVAAQEQQPMVVSQQQSAASIVLLQVKRSMKVYPIQEHELMMIQSWGSDKTLWSSVGAGALAWLLSCCWDWAQMPESSHMSLGAKLFIGVLLAACAFSFCRAGWRKWRIKKSLDKILSESEVV